ncbi:hypothetical protein TNIN_70591 [Trichonephila inaurata madagascariensis]|uniref:Uncharacterized protein n=1 Tax=Trichonephila inaurata madagascariensis TaxID=2747483 RepID=A0A8X6Y9Y7_9ARAC|nr:hypothetical protein TNIN_70531 [Trichonephila inaurata madagascariensis]GFY68414.1 hypothetical protein TNIN_70591 [Trichonephila inaurata madagascariensis]
MRGLEGTEPAGCAEAFRPTFPDVRGQAKHIILGNRETQTSPGHPCHTARNRSDLIYATSAINFNGRSVTGLTPLSRCPVKGLSVCSRMSHAHPRPRPALVCRGPIEGSEGRSCCAEARPTFPDVRGQVEDIILGNRETQTSLSGHLTQPETGATLIYATSN